jgi:hypothetical protein
MIRVWRQKCSACNTIAEFRTPTENEMDWLSTIVVKNILEKYYEKEITDAPREKRFKPVEPEHDKSKCNACRHGVCRTINVELREKYGR